MFKVPTHVIISWVFFILIGIVFCYSYFFYPDTHPIDCLIKTRTGKDCPSCGFSRAFSCYTHLQINEGQHFNPLSLHVFLFLMVQFIMRLLVILHYKFTKKNLPPLYVKTDIIISISGFLFAFLPLVLKI